MANIIIVAILVVVIFFAFRGTRSHMKGEGGCCGGGGGTIVTKADIPVKKLEGERLGEKVVDISGMHCEHCVLSVTKAINAIDGAAAFVDLKRNRAIVDYDRVISDSALKQAIEAEGFTVNSIKEA